MNAIEETLNSKARPSGIGPGERLQAARIQQGLSIEDIAQRMHLSVDILEAIEENNFDEITAPIFVKGYLRAYARIVSLDEDEMIQQYIDFYSGDDPPILSTSNMAPELSAADARIKWTTYLVILVLVALLGAWWWNKENNEETPISLDSQPAAQQQVETDTVSSEIEAASETGSTALVPEPVVVEGPEPSGAGSDLAAQDGQPDSGDAAQVEPEPIATAVPENAAQAESGLAQDASPESAQSVDTASAQIDQPATSATTEIETTAAAQDATLDSAAEEASDAATGEAPAAIPGMIAPSGSDELVIVVNADTWADIKDGNDFQMVYDLLRAGRSISLTGSAPFSVFLGNGHGVEISFNDAAVDFSARIRDNNTARLVIGQ